MKPSREAIILDAKEAGFCEWSAMSAWIDQFERLYLSAYRAGMERAAGICDNVDVDPCTHHAWNAAVAIRKEMEE